LHCAPLALEQARLPSGKPAKRANENSPPIHRWVRDQILKSIVFPAVNCWAIIAA
jgi:hypothetical protein